MPDHSPVLYNMFVQANTIRGNRYLDDAGKIMNFYEEDFPAMEVGLDGLKMRNPDTKLRTVQVTTELVWVHIELPDTLTYGSDQAYRIISRVCDIIDVTQLKRMGMRFVHLISTENTGIRRGTMHRRVFNSYADNVLNGVYVNTGNTDKVMEFKVSLKEKERQIDIRIAEVERTANAPDAQRIPGTAILIDSDIHREGKFELSEFGRFLRDGQRWISTNLPTLVAAFVPEEQ